MLLRLVIVRVIIFSVMITGLSWLQTEAGVWRDDFEDKRINEWKIYNEDRTVEKWWINQGAAVGEIFRDGFMSLWLTGSEDWNNYSLSCRAKLIKQKNNTEPYFGLTLYDAGEENARYLHV